MPKLRKKKGFTLIELLIVVAIIAILAAIAIPQFSSYRIKGYNSAALADLRNARTAEEAFYSDWQGYAPTAAPGTGVVVGTPYGSTTAPIVVGKDSLAVGIPSADTNISFGMSQNVLLTVTTGTSGGSFVALTKNGSGDRCFGMDSSNTSIFWSPGVLSGGLADRLYNRYEWG